MYLIQKQQTQTPPPSQDTSIIALPSKSIILLKPARLIAFSLSLSLLLSFMPL